MSNAAEGGSKLLDADVQREVDEINALFANLGDDDDVNASWMADLVSNNTNNQSALNTSTGNLLDASFDGFDSSTGDNWIFPLGFEKRQYQREISQITLYHNTLVILPTGLGKTFIASVTIYNFFRWYPKSKIIFMAPTRPLVNQQISACYDVVGIPKEETAEMTGKISNKDKRKELWHTKRVFFATPQVVSADMADGILPTNLIKLLVFDEAHKAKKEYAYCKVMQGMLQVQNKFRVLALTATAGKTPEVVQIIQNLLISRIEFRTEDSLDVRPYTHKKNIQTVCVKLTAELQEIDKRFMEFVDPIIAELRQHGFVKGQGVSKGYLIMEQLKIKDCSTLSNRDKSTLYTLITTAIGFFHSLEILQRHSVHLFLKSLRDESGDHHKFFVAKDRKVSSYVKELEAKYAEKSPFQAGVNSNGRATTTIIGENVDFGHPKFDILKEKLREYFNEKEGTKAIIFCEYRDTTALIHAALLQMRPLVEPKCLVGQGGKVTQKEQLKIMKEFREGNVNTLICTCVAEEGLDIGSVDLVICFDIGSKNSTRFVQRIGRTARKRAGSVIVLATEGRELQMIKDLVATKDSINKSISRNKDIAKYFYQAPRLIPKQFNPKCIETRFAFESEQPDEKEDAPVRKGKKGKKLLPSRSKESITNHFKPASRKKLTAAAGVAPTEHGKALNEVDVEVIGTDVIRNGPRIATVKISAEKYTEMYMTRINQFIKDNYLEDNEFYKNLIEYRSKDGLNSIKRLVKILESTPAIEEPPMEINFDEIAENLALSPVGKTRKSTAMHDRCHDRMPSRYGGQFDLGKSSSPFVPVKMNTSNGSFGQLQQLPTNTQFATPDFSQFQRHSRKVSASTPLCGRNLASEMNDIFYTQHATERHDKESVMNTSESKDTDGKSLGKFPFLGLNSLSDIFEGCQTNLFNSTLDDNLPHGEEDQNSKSMEVELLNCSAHNHLLSADEESIGELEKSYLSMTEEPEMERDLKVLKKIDLDNLSDLFGGGGAPEESAQETSGASDKTQIYDVEEEISRIERDRKPRVVLDDVLELSDNETRSSHGKENAFESTSTSLARPNVANLIAVMSRDSFGKSLMTSQSVLRPHNSYTQSSPITPVRKKPRALQCETAPESPAKSGSSDDEHCITQTPIARRRKRKASKKPRNGFLCTQVAVDDDESDGDTSDGGEQDSSLGGFVVNETVHDNNRTLMHLKYIQSLKSPNAPINRRNLLSRPLNPMSLSQIYSQLPQGDEEEESIDEEEDEFASFIVRTDEEEDESEQEEEDELDMAEKRLRELNRRKRMNVSDEPAAAAALPRSKRRKIVNQLESSSEDEELERIRREVDMY